MTNKEKLSASVADTPSAQQPVAADMGNRTAGEGPQPDHEPLYVSFGRATQISGLGKSTLYRAAMDGRLRLVKAGRSTLVCYKSLRALLDSLPAAHLRNAA